MIDNDLYENIISIDTETTGLRPQNSLLWSIGTTTKSGTKEKYLGNELFTEEARSSFLQQARANSVFQQKQEGAYQAYFNSIQEGRFLTDQEAGQFLLDSLDEGKILMAQNVNFENKFLTKAAQRSGFYESIRDRMEFSTPPIEDLDRPLLFYRPPSVTMGGYESSDLFERLAEDLKKGGSNYQANLEAYEKSTTNVVDEYGRIAKQAKGIITADLQDFTKALYATAAYKGQLSPEALTARTTNIEVLSQILLGQKEAHTAGSDSAQQFELFKKISTMYNQLKTGNVSDETRGYLSELNRVLPYSKESSMYSSALQALEELKLEKQYKIFKGIQTGTSEIKVNSQTWGSVNFKYRDYAKARITTDHREVLDDVARRYRDSGLNADAIEALKNVDHDTAIQRLAEQTAQAKQRLTNFINRTEDIPPQSVSTLSADELINQITPDRPAKQIDVRLPRLSRSQKMVGGFGLGILGLFMLSGSEREQKEKEKTKRNTLSNKIKEQGNTPNAVFDAFGYNIKEPVVYHGQGWYHWDNRTGHHQA